MRRKKRLREKVVSLLIFLSLILISYLFGYSQGQASVYTKVQNDKKLMQMEYSNSQ